MTHIARRRLLQLSGAGLASAATGGLAAILASGRAPAFAQGTTIHWVRGSDYVPVSDQMVRTKLNELAQKDLGIKINLEGVDGLTIQARVTSSVQSGSGPDIIMRDQQLGAALRRQRRRCQRRRGRDRQGAGRLLRDLEGDRLSTARSGSPCPTRSSGCRSPIGPRGGRRSATTPRNIRRPGRNGARPARS